MTYEPKNLKLWTHPNNYIGEVWPAHYRSGFGRSRDSDCIEESNFHCALKALGGESDTVRVVCEGHWAVGWVEWIAIHQDDEVALREADRLRDLIEEFPILDENDLTERETEAANETWTNCYNDAERLEYIRNRREQFDFRDFADLIGCVRGRHFNGYASELLY